MPYNVIRPVYNRSVKIRYRVCVNKRGQKKLHIHFLFHLNYPIKISIIPSEYFKLKVTYTIQRNNSKSLGILHFTKRNEILKEL
ncbi:hypothetical protein HanXRQr2_Chr17g0781551 [Helianthus annuus]|uniref:Uncharacterized protein n=1 Tax=Helianthus annuus TaxID=4232 RepID=A0A9K3GRV9_HELAN|nr:hypothetical protein HanXRQr2_Chr17g0781551 [Helianthus annuus]KAJ0811361.1 hypothetical protein HanPSC8_Chr17g0749871 [Helianthus annuus]